MPRVNNIDLDKVMETVNAIKSDPTKAKRTIKVSGSWVFGNPEVQFRTAIQTEKRGTFVVEVDSPSFMGGSGSRPSPMHYCAIGISSCFMATLMGVAAEKGIELSEALITIECTIDFSKPLGVADKPIIEEVNVKVSLKDGAERKILQEIVDEAYERCPAMYSLRNPVKVSVKLE